MINKKNNVILYSYTHEFSHIGQLILITSNDKIWAVAFPDEVDLFFKKLKRLNIKFELIEKKIPLHNQVIHQLNNYLSKKPFHFDFSCEFLGTDFQKKVWKQLLKLKSNEVISYKELGRRLGMESGFQAIGQANKANSICILVPCHRVISNTGHLSGYLGGSQVKQYLLNLESSF